ncbi:MAG: flagellar protein FlaG [Panacagrimonas sp.]
MTTEKISFNATALAPPGEGFRALLAPTSGTVPAVSASASAAEPLEVSVATLGDAVRKLSDFIAQTDAELSFRIDEESGRVVVSLIDSRDGTVLRQMPSEEALRIARSLSSAREPCLIRAEA